MYIGLHVKYLYSCKILTKLELSCEIFEKYSNIKIHDNPFCGSEVVHAGGRTDRQTGMSKLMVAFCNYANVPKYND
jgi:hypothetical protein